MDTDENKAVRELVGSVPVEGLIDWESLVKGLPY